MLGSKKRLFSIGCCVGLSALSAGVLGTGQAAAVTPITVTVTNTPTTFAASGTGTYTVALTNNLGTPVAQNLLTLTDTLPPGLQAQGALVPSDPSVWTCTGLTCTNNRDAFAPGATPTFTLSVSVATIPPACTLTNTATATIPPNGVVLGEGSDPTTIAGGGCPTSSGGTGGTTSTQPPTNITIINDNHSSATNTNTTTVTVHGGNAEAEANAKAAIVTIHHPAHRARHHHHCRH